MALTDAEKSALSLLIAATPVTTALDSLTALFGGPKAVETVRTINALSKRLNENAPTLEIGALA